MLTSSNYFSEERLSKELRKAIASYWRIRSGQAEAQRLRGSLDHGARAAVTGGKQMAGFLQLLTDLLVSVGIRREHIFSERALDLPGYFRPTKEWDLLVVRDQRLIAAIELKSQAGPSFGNNFNNRAEEAIGSAVDLWTAFREGAFNSDIQPWLGYVFLLEDCVKSRAPVYTREPHFPVFPEFKHVSYVERYEILCRKLVRERHYNAACFLLSPSDGGEEGKCTEPAKDLSFRAFVKSLTAHAAAYVQG